MPMSAACCLRVLLSKWCVRFGAACWCRWRVLSEWCARFVVADYSFIMLLSEWCVRFQAGMLARLHGTASWCRCKWRAHFGAGMLVPLQGAALKVHAFFSMRMNWCGFLKGCHEVFGVFVSSIKRVACLHFGLLHKPR